MKKNKNKSFGEQADELCDKMNCPDNVRDQVKNRLVEMLANASMIEKIKNDEYRLTMSASGKKWLGFTYKF